MNALKAWQAHQRAGITVFPPDAPIVTGTTILLTIRAIAIWVLAPCRIIYVIDDRERFGFAYGTLEGHPEQGEAAFNLSLGGDQRVCFEIGSFSRPINVIARIASPLSRGLQLRVTGRYLTGLTELISPAVQPPPRQT